MFDVLYNEMIIAIFVKKTTTITFQRLPECDNLPLMSHLICPIQRVMRYHLLLSEYLKYLDQTDADYADTKEALNLALKAANHANEIMRKLVKIQYILD